MNLEKARILIVGATGGIGSAVASRLKRAGTELLLHGRHRKSLDEPSYIQGDLSFSCEIEKIVRAAEAFDINMLINCAGVNQFSRFESADIDRLLNINVAGPMKLTQMLLPHLKSKQESVILNVGSTFGAIGYPGYVAYCATKHAIKGFTEALSRELSDSTVSVQYFSPRATNTSINPRVVNEMNHSLGVGSDEPGEVAREIVQALVRGRSRSQMGNPESVQVKINSLFPSIVDSAVAKQLPVIREHLVKTEQEI
ncbi:MAG: SDR family oxidoreductase [Gammaproteobacteria bacterium]|jgi:short-subunit dehydrogenase|nr:SDR family oxidoreductase [Gammaproteobacteria bacterium]MBT4493503.1 SDR family oxidoreductase [Gammaproteobacteria bacterium]MBT7369729.1 SDR family oxidoreductase [Gammaproteobacteria bacterium]